MILCILRGYNYCIDLFGDIRGDRWVGRGEVHW